VHRKQEKRSPAADGPKPAEMVGNMLKHPNVGGNGVIRWFGWVSEDSSRVARKQRVTSTENGKNGARVADGPKPVEMVGNVLKHPNVGGNGVIRWFGSVSDDSSRVARRQRG
jgi:hypothetical protein